ncbi:MULTISPECIES: hypothetical protein [unclassified Sphingopyxis]|uniref:hypothetical protein n=1 Tax=unclassified Sphingopyxis TaxID=2614943 RepID=UPI0007377FB4|nr:MULTISPECIES: hypothetical protein [unclassified Sphingopyxis]KTE29501.1 hypothetical protein ATE62_20940 [Sphingopyxis sp. HIX]KTE79282.1 hypothetical protein ATE72_19095 [Sphingopyxis sp. HXXIV]
MKRTMMIPALLLAAAAPGVARAQDATAETAGDAAACDVAVWTTAQYNADRIGLVTGGLIDAMLKGASVPEINSSEAIKSMLPAETLFDVISHSKLDQIIGRPINYIRVDKGPKEAEADRKNKARAYASDNPCFIEVHLWLVYYQSAPFHGERIFSYWRIKDFRGPKPVSTGGYDNGQMKDFSKQDVATATEMAKGAIAEVFEKTTRKKLQAKVAR